MTSAPDTPMDVEAVRRQLSGRKGRELWKSLEELSGSETFREAFARAQPAEISFGEPTRRDALRYLAVTLAASGAAACTKQPAEQIFPYARNPEATIPGKPQFFATAMPWPTGAIGVLVESHEGRPTKVEGNAEHPASLGATDAFAQASLLSLYDPDRTQVVQRRGRPDTWNGLLTELRGALVGQEPKRGAGLRVLTPGVTSPTLARQLRAVLETYPEARWHQWDPINRDAERAGALAAFGRDVQPRPNFGRADVVLSLGADFLGGGPESVRLTREFVKRRKGAGEDGRREQNRLYVLESSPTLTGATAEHRRARKPSGVVADAKAILFALSGGDPPSDPWLAALARDLAAHRGRSVVLAGREQPPLVHELAHRMNALLGNAGVTVDYLPPVQLEPVDQGASIRELADDMHAGEVDLLVIVEGNPVYDAPADCDFAGALDRVELKVHLALSEDETSNRCDWHAPKTTFLESWSDVRAADGTVSIVQPLIAPLYAGRSEHELIAAVAGTGAPTPYEAVRETWRTERGENDFERFWRRAVHDGRIADTAFEPVAVELAAERSAEPTPSAPFELVLAPDPTVWDGRFANNGWLQELPKPLTKLTWDNAVLVAPATAERLGLANGDVVEVASGERSVEGPIWIVPGHADHCATLHLGYGREVCGSMGIGAGFDAYRLRDERTRSGPLPAELKPTGRKHELASTQDHHSMEGRDLVRAASVESFREDPHLFEHDHHGPKGDTSMYPGFEYEGNSWGMVIDLGACTGCSACVVACQSENSIPIVGKEEVSRGREMHWIRIDRYFEGEVDAPAVHHQPVPCMHCENAPCEVVCPVNATVHGGEGLNEMVYNRCVGTRYCSNNCPYKVRRFNFYRYADYETEILKLGRNPDVTVRHRGVMEKCTYCVQRINEARIEAKKEGRPIRDGEVRTACQSVCPAEAIAFGNLNDESSEVVKWKSSSLNYGLLEELNVAPRTTYLAKLDNPNPELAPEDEHGDGHGHGHEGGHG